jgi:hypothetical protein
MYCSVVSGGYLLGLDALVQLGKLSMMASKLGLQKNAIDCRAGVMPSVALIFIAGGATTR